MGFPGGSGGKESASQCRRCKFNPGEENGNPLQYSCLGNPLDRGTQGATVNEVTKSQTALSD